MVELPTSPIADLTYYIAICLISYSFMRGNPNPSQKLKPVGDKALTNVAVNIRLTEELAEYLSQEPNKTQWVRNACLEKMQREQATAG